MRLAVVLRTAGRKKGQSWKIRMYGWVESWRTGFSRKNNGLGVRGSCIHSMNREKLREQCKEAEVGNSLSSSPNRQGQRLECSE